MNTYNITGTGILLKTLDGSYLFQERDKYIDRNPGKITPFGGGINDNETPIECAIRELEEELKLNLLPHDLIEIGVFESHFNPGTYIQLFIVKNLDPKSILLSEGYKIRDMSLEQALNDPRVTDFTKEVLTTARSRSIL